MRVIEVSLSGEPVVGLDQVWTTEGLAREEPLPFDNQF